MITVACVAEFTVHSRMTALAVATASLRVCLLSAFYPARRMSSRVLGLDIRMCVGVDESVCCLFSFTEIFSSSVSPCKVS